MVKNCTQNYFEIGFHWLKNVRSYIGWEENKTLLRLQRVWKLLTSRRVLKPLRENSKWKTQRRQYLLAVGLGRYKWYQSQIPSDVSTRRSFLEGGRHEAVCQ